MAKLSANGYEVARIVREVASVDDTDTEWARSTFSFRSNGKSMRKLDVRFKATRYREAYNHSYGWKQFGKWTEAGLRTHVENVNAGKILGKFTISGKV